MKIHTYFTQSIIVTITALLGTACSSRKAAPVAQQPIANQNGEAPATIKGKTFVWDYTQARCYTDYGNGKWEPVREKNNIIIDSFTSMRNTGVDPNGCDTGSGPYLSKRGDQYFAYDYKKTGNNKGLLTTGGYEDSTTYSLHFDSATTGTASYKGDGEGMAWKGSGLRFAVK